MSNTALFARHRDLLEQYRTAQACGVLGRPSLRKIRKRCIAAGLLKLSIGPKHGTKKHDPTPRGRMILDVIEALSTTSSESPLLIPANLTARWLVVRTTFEGYHRWPDAPDDVAFLRSLHRHLFHVVLSIATFHDDRELEFIQVRRRLHAEVLDVQTWPEAFSCESMAGAIAQWASANYGARRLKVEVSEDGENGAVLEFGPSV